MAHNCNRDRPGGVAALQQPCLGRQTAAVELKRAFTGKERTAQGQISGECFVVDILNILVLSLNIS